MQIIEQLKKWWKSPLPKQKISFKELEEKNPELIICSVCKNESDYLNLNWNISTPKKTPFKWIVANDCKRLRPEFEKIDFHHVQRLTKLEKIKQQVQVKDKSIEHATNLQRVVDHALKHYNPRFLMVLDPDFFIFQDLDYILSNLAASNAAVFGAPYARINAKGLDKCRDVPVAFCMIFDLWKYSKEHIHFSAGYGRDFDAKLYPDTGYRMYRKIIQSYQSEIALPVDYYEPAHKHTDKGVREIYHNPIISSFPLRVDEYMYRGELFGLHLRGKMSKYGQRNKEYPTTTEQRTQDHLTLVEEVYKIVNPIKIQIQN